MVISLILHHDCKLYATQKACPEQLASTDQAEIAWHSFCPLPALGALSYGRSMTNGFASTYNDTGGSSSSW